MSRILVVEDDPAVRALLAEFLGESGYACTTVGSAGEARALLAANPIDLVITDCVLYGEQGEELAQHLASTGIAVILMSGNIERLATLQRQAVAVLQKPFRLAELGDLIRRRLPTEV